jgi:hypothetical protein
LENNDDGNKKKQSDGRRYPRVFLTKGVLDFDRIVGLDVKWPGGFVTGVLDISYIGAAIVKTSKITQKFPKGEIIEFLFSFANGATDIPFDGEVIREDDKAIAVHFPELSLQARKALDGFLKQKLVGLNTKLVDTKYYTKEQGFQYWFHGPNQTNVFVWGDLNHIQKATFELNNEVMTFEKGKFYLSESRNFLQAPTEDYTHGVNNPEEKELLKQKNTKRVVNDVMSLLSQIEDPTGIIKKVTETMLVFLDK